MIKNHPMNQLPTSTLKASDSPEKVVETDNLSEDLINQLIDCFADSELPDWQDILQVMQNRINRDDLH